MKLEWMGRYRKLSGALVHHTNCTFRGINTRLITIVDVKLTSQELQVFEYILEHEDEHKIMADIADELAMARSTVSKVSKYLLEKGLVERYRFADNKKSIILLPSEKGRAGYLEHYEAEGYEIFASFFEKLNALSDEQLDIFAEAIGTLDRGIEVNRAKKNIPLVKI